MSWDKGSFHHRFRFAPRGRHGQVLPALVFLSATSHCTVARDDPHGDIDPDAVGGRPDAGETLSPATDDTGGGDGDGDGDGDSDGTPSMSDGTSSSGDATDSGDSGDPPNNHAPTAHAGAARVAYDGKSSLSGTSSFDLDGDPLAYRWTQRGGPAPALLDDPHAEYTSVQLPEQGHYRFRLTVDDGYETDSRDVLVVWHQDVAEGETPKPEFVVHISVDGLRSDIVSRIGAQRLPNFYRLRAEGAFTDNARADNSYTITVPNHACQVTGRPVVGANGHAYYFNFTFDQTLHEHKDSYVASVFDVVHDHGLNTGYFASKSKLDVLRLSYNGQHGAEDRVGEDNGRAKIDHVYINFVESDLVTDFEQVFEATPFEYTFLHLADPDSTGHSVGWSDDPNSPYADAVVRVDGLLGRVLAAIERSLVTRDRTVVVLTADHGGSEFGHNDPAVVEHFTIPFYVWGASVAPADLYALNHGRRIDPGLTNWGPGAGLQPIRNGDAANLACGALGLPNVPGSLLNVEQPLLVR